MVKDKERTLGRRLAEEVDVEDLESVAGGCSLSIGTECGTPTGGRADQCDIDD